MPGVPRAAPVRTCVGCRRAAPKGELIRLTRLAGGVVAIGGSPGRGAYVHRDLPCVERAMRPAALARALRGGLSVDEVGRLRERIEGELESV